MLGIGIVLCLVCGTVAVLTGSAWAAIGCCIGLLMVAHGDQKDDGTGG